MLQKNKKDVPDLPTNSEQFCKVMKLSMDVSAYSNWTSDGLPQIHQNISQEKLLIFLLYTNYKINTVQRNQIAKGNRINFLYHLYIILLHQDFLGFFTQSPYLNACNKNCSPNEHLSSIQKKRQVYSQCMGIPWRIHYEIVFFDDRAQNCSFYLRQAQLNQIPSSQALMHCRTKCEFNSEITIKSRSRKTKALGRNTRSFICSRSLRRVIRQASCDIDKRYSDNESRQAINQSWYKTKLILVHTCSRNRMHIRNVSDIKARQTQETMSKFHS